MAKSAILTLRILGDAKDAQKAVRDAEGTVAGFSSALDKVTVPATAIAGGLAVFGKSAIDAASQVEQAMGGVDAIFGDSADTVKRYADGAASNLGLAKGAYADLANVIGAQLKNAGTPVDELAGKTNDLITTGADLAATFGGTTQEAVEALSSALKGEMDPIERYGISLNESAVNAEMAAQGTAGLTGAAQAAAKQQAILALIQKQGADASGQFAAQIDTTAEQQQIANAQWQNAQAVLGQKLLPLATRAAQMFARFASFLSRNSTAATILGAALGGVSVAILAINGALKAYQAATAAASAIQAAFSAAAVGTRIQLVALAVQQAVVSTATKAWAAVQWVLNAALSANPIGIVIALIAALVAGIILAWNKSEGFRNVVITGWNAIKDAAAAVWDWIVAKITGIWNSLVAAGKRYIQIYSAAWTAIRTAAAAVWDWIVSKISSVWNGLVAAGRSYINVYVSIWNGLRSAAGSVWDWIRSAATNALNAIMGPINAVRSAFNTVVSAIQQVIDWLSRIRIPSALSSIGSAIGGILGRSAPRAAAGPAPRMRGAALRAGTAGGGTGGGVHITIQGAVDPDATARQIRRLLDRADRRRGGVVVGAAR